MRLIVLTFFGITTLPLLAQYPGGGYPPGGYPPGGGYPGGGYPPGSTYPGGRGGTGIPFPRRGKKTPKDQQKQLQTTSGMLREITDDSIVISAEDSRIINFKRADSTKFLKGGKEIPERTIKPGDHVSIEASQDETGYLHAVRVTFEKEGTAQERAEAAKRVDIESPSSDSDSSDERPKMRRKDDSANAAPAPATSPESPAKVEKVESEPVAVNEPITLPPNVERIPASPEEAQGPIDESDPGPPHLKRGKPAARKPAKQQQTQTVARNSAPATVSAKAESAPAPARLPSAAEPAVDAKIEKARAAVGSFTESLPNYVCKEQVARFVSTTHKVDWHAQDVVATDVVYDNHREQYKNLTINGKPVKKGEEEKSGAWSTGEFGTVLVDLFSPATSAAFRQRGNATIAGRAASLYDFSVEQPNSHWRVTMASQSVFPAYKGSVWIDQETSRVLRIEMQSFRMPTEFPLDKVESATDYEFVRIGDQRFLLPVHAETLSCERGTDNCSRNVIDFRNYHKFTGESSIKYEQ
jgi:hypothetical protein